MGPTPPPPEQLRDLLAGMRHSGAPFERAWPAAVDRIRMRGGGVDIPEHWQCAYERAPETAALRALRILHLDLDFGQTSANPPAAGSPEKQSGERRVILAGR